MKQTMQEWTKSQNEILQEIHNGYKRWAALTQFFLAILTVALFLLGGFSFYLNGENHSRIDDIQQQRKDFIDLTCREQNQRNTNTKATLKNIYEVGSQGLTESRRARRAESFAATSLLIDSLAPKRQCDELVRRTVGAK